MAKNNCKQCEENSKWRILGTDCSQAIFDTLESCENYKEGYGFNFFPKWIKRKWF